MHSIPQLLHPGIRADKTLVEQFKNQMPDDMLHIGICWRASKKPVAGGTRIIDRNIPLRFLTELAAELAKEMILVQLWSVQGPPDKFLTESEFSRLEHQNKTGTIDPWLDVIPDRHARFIKQVTDDNARPFENTAAAIAACDMFVGCDTVFPNLAAMIGKKTCFLLKQEHVDMRWGTKPDTTPWFENAMLLRQETPGNWQAPLEVLYEIMESEMHLKIKSILGD